MYKQGVGDFKYFVGVSSLAQVATREDRVCVLNILGGESSEVTPVGHAYSGGNVVFGTSPGRRGQVLETPLGNVPVYNNVLEGINDGHRFNCGVIYLPPAAARLAASLLLVELAIDQALERFECVLLVRPLHADHELRALACREEKEAEDAFAVHLVSISGQSHLRVEARGGVHDFRGGARVEAQPVLQPHRPLDHGTLRSVSISSEAARMARRPRSTNA